MMFLLDKLYELPPENGRISIGGVDINDISTPYLRENIGMVLQEPFLFSRSIAENISIAGEEVDMAAVREASRAACLDETVEGFTQGYDTFVGERGVTLSAEVTETFELQQAFDDLLLVQPIDEVKAKRLIFQMASAQYSAIDNSEYETARLQRMVSKCKTLTELDADLLAKIVDKVIVNRISTQVILKNGQIINSEEVL